MTVLLVFGLFVVIATAHNITLLEVPRYGDPRRDANLVCHYVNDKDDPPLHSVKWYRDSDEIFRYTPGQQPETRTFNTTAGAVTRGDCNQHRCSINVGLPKQYSTRISYTCEVSTEGPRFAFVKETKNLTVAVTLKQDPVVTGVPHSVSLGEEVLLNCSAGPAMPQANLQWYIDGKPEMMSLWDNPDVTTATADGLRMSWRQLRLIVTTVRGAMAVSCEARQAVRPAFVRSTNVSLAVARSPHLSMSMFTASGSSTAQAALVLLAGAALHVLCKSALTDV